MACVAPLTAVFARPVEEVGAAELQRACLALAHMISLDCVAVGGEWMKSGKWLAAYTSEDNALSAALRKPLAELSRSDCLLAAAAEAALAAAWATKGFDPLLGAASITMMEFMGAFMAANPYGPVLGTDERNNRLSTLVAEAIRDERAEMSEGVLTGAWMLLWQLSNLRPATCVHQIDSGCLDVAVAELRTMPSSDWVALSRCPSGRAGAVFLAILAPFLSARGSPGDPGTPGLLEVCLEAMSAYAQAGASDDTSAVVAVCAPAILFNARLFSQSEANAEAIRAAAQSIRYVMDNPQTVMSDIGFSSRYGVGKLVCEAFGGDEGDTLQLSQQDVDDIVAVFCDYWGAAGGGINPLKPQDSGCVRDLWVSDHHKTLLLRNADTIPHLVSGLFLDPDHPRGLKAKEILGPQAHATDLEVQAIFQQNFSEALAQLALFPAGKEALLADESVVPSLEAVVERGMSEEAKEFARNALIGLRGFAEHEAVVAEHVMLSYEWSSQSIIVRVNDSLKRRGYATWLDVEQMKGSIMDA